jgi:hypothetical protein
MTAARFPWLLGLCAVLGLLLGWASGGLPARGEAFGGGFAPQVPETADEPNRAGAIAAYDAIWRGVNVRARAAAAPEPEAPQWRLVGVIDGQAVFVSPDAGGMRLVGEGETAPDGRRVARIGAASVAFEGDEQETRLYDGAGGEGP